MLTASPRVLLALAILTAGCTSNRLVNRGEGVYSQPLEDGNSFSCSTCHALTEPADDGLHRVAHPIGDATRRPHFKNGRIEDVRDAVNTCVEHWMNAEPLAETDPRWEALYAFLDAQATVEQAPALAFEITPPPGDLEGGDVDAGRTLFDRTCVACHGAGATGTTRAPPLAGGSYEAGYIAERVRLSGDQENPAYEGLVGGVMPFWSADRLSDGELRDVIAYVRSLSDAPPPPPPTDGGTGPDGGVGGDCVATHPLVGATGALSTFAHDVSGTVRVVDDCTIVIEDFHYDGRGIDVRIYAGLGGDYDAGFAISRDLLRATPYAGETLVLTLPAGRTLDDLDGVSVWCVDVGVSFGDATLTP